MPRPATRILRQKSLSWLADAESQRERAIIEAIEESQRCIAQELHDTICQTLSGVRLSAAALRRRTLPADERLAADFARFEDVAGRTIGELHDLVRSLQSPEVSVSELSAALDELAREIRGKIACDFRVAGRPSVADDFAASQLLQIAWTLARHALRSKRVTRLAILWSEDEDEQQCVLSVRAEEPVFIAGGRAGDELHGSKLLLRRVRAAGSKLTFDPAGTCARVTMPAPPIETGA